MTTALIQINESRALGELIKLAYLDQVQERRELLRSASHDHIRIPGTAYRNYVATLANFHALTIRAEAGLLPGRAESSALPRPHLRFHDQTATAYYVRLLVASVPRQPDR